MEVKNDICSSCSKCGGLKRNPVPNSDFMLELAEFFKNFADTTRMKILTALDEEELCVCEISERLSMTDSAVSHQLKMLRNANLVRSERRGKHIYYSLADTHVRDIIEKAIEHIQE